MPTRATTVPRTATFAGTMAFSPISARSVQHMARVWAESAAWSSTTVHGSWPTSGSTDDTTGVATSSAPYWPLPASSSQPTAWARSENRVLVVHPLNQGEIWDGCNAETLRLTMAAPAAPNEWMPVVIPVGRGTCDDVLDFAPAFKATPFQGQ